MEHTFQTHDQIKLRTYLLQKKVVDQDATILTRGTFKAKGYNNDDLEISLQ